MIDLASDEILTLAEAAARLRVSVKTIRQWTRGQVRGRRLDCALLGGRYVTCLRALQEFSEQSDELPERERSQSAAKPSGGEALRRLMERHGGKVVGRAV